MGKPQAVTDDHSFGHFQAMNVIQASVGYKGRQMGSLQPLVDPNPDYSIERIGHNARFYKADPRDTVEFSVCSNHEQIPS
jgi:hypothetical protein